MYYTFRINKDHYEVTKWEWGNPLDTFEVRWDGNLKRQNANMCSCPARVPCRHMDMLWYMIDSGCILEHWLWYFENDQFYTAYDQQEWI
jgi:hypothetical protein